jgi:hypothetical protein
MIVREKHLQTDAKLSQIANTLNSLRSSFCVGNRGQQQCSQNANYRDDNQ